MKRLALALTGMLGWSAWSQQLPVRYDPLYDVGAALLKEPLSMADTPRALDEWQDALQNAPESRLRTVALWKLGDTERLPTGHGALFVQTHLYGYLKEDWQTPAKATYRVSGVYALGEQALLEWVWSDAPRFAPPAVVNLPEPSPEAFDTLPLARLTFRTGEGEWQFGRAPLRWAGGYSGGLLINDSTPPIAYGKVAFPLRIPLVGEWRFEQFFAQTRQSGQTVWWGGRRFERELGRRWTLSLAEAFKALSLPDGALSQIAPYYAYQKWMSTAERGSGWFNYLAEVGVQYRFGEQNCLYAFWLTDDMRAPDFWGGRGASTPRKTALLIGARLYPNPPTRVVLELVRTDGTRNGGVYGDSGHDPRYAYTLDGFPMGHPFGANQIGFYGRLDYQHKAWLVSLEGYNLRRFHAWYGGERGFEFNASLARQVDERTLIRLRYRTRSLRNAGDPDARCGWQLEWQQRF